MITSPLSGVSDMNVQPAGFNGFTEHDAMAQLYPFPAIRLVRIARDTDKKIGDFQLTAEVVRQLDEDQVGVLIANCEHPDKIHEKILKLAETEYPAPWVVVLSSIDLARWWYAVQQGKPTQQIDANSEANTYWRTGNCWFTRLERLEALTRLPQFHGPIAGIILIDPTFCTQHARGLRDSRWSHNDRPELMNSFRSRTRPGRPASSTPVHVLPTSEVTQHNGRSASLLPGNPVVHRRQPPASRCVVAIPMYVGHSCPTQENLPTVFVYLKK